MSDPAVTFTPDPLGYLTSYLSRPCAGCTNDCDVANGGKGCRHCDAAHALVCLREITPCTIAET